MGYFFHPHVGLFFVRLRCWVIPPFLTGLDHKPHAAISVFVQRQVLMRYQGGHSLFELLAVLTPVASAVMLAPPAINALRRELRAEKIAGE